MPRSRRGCGIPPTPDDETVPIGLLVRLSVPARPTPAPRLPPRLRRPAAGPFHPRFPARGHDRRHVRDVNGVYEDGTPYTLVQPTYTIEDPLFGPVGDETMLSPRLAPQVVGMGLLEHPAEDLVATADPDDEDGDGISGRVNMVVDDRSASS